MGGSSRRGQREITSKRRKLEKRDRMRMRCVKLQWGIGFKAEYMY